MFVFYGWVQKINTDEHFSCGWANCRSVYTVTLHIQMNAEWNDTPNCEFLLHGVLLVSPPLPWPPESPSWKHVGVQSFSSSRVSFCRPFSRLRWDTSARWAALRRTRWPPADTWRWPPLLAPSRLRLNFSCAEWKLKFRPLPNKRDCFHFCWVNWPFHEEHEFSCGIRGPDDSLWNQPSSKAPQLLWLRVRHPKIRTKVKSSYFLFKWDRYKSGNRLCLISFKTVQHI